MALTASAESQSKRGTILAIVIAVHAVGLWVVESGLSRSIIEMVAPPVETKIIEEQTPPEEPPPPPPPPPMEATPPPPYIPPVEVQVQLPPPVNAITAETKETPPPVAPPIMAPSPPAVASTRPIPRASRSLESYYPSESKKAKEEGTVRVKCTVKLNGKCAGTAIDSSSGFPRLDEAAVKYMNDLSFKPATTEGKPVEVEVTLPVRFAITAK
jgi:protein TonB